MSSAAPSASGAASLSQTHHWERSKPMRIPVPRRRVSTSQPSTTSAFRTVATTNHCNDPNPAIVTPTMSANAAACPSTFDTAMSRSQSRASNRRINPKATDRMTRLSPPSAVPITIDDE